MNPITLKNYESCTERQAHEDNCKQEINPNTTSNYKSCQDKAEKLCKDISKKTAEEKCKEANLENTWNGISCNDSNPYTDDKYTSCKELEEDVYSFKINHIKKLIEKYKSTNPTLTPSSTLTRDQIIVKKIWNMILYGESMLIILN